jgi:hypothetical protein
VNGRFTLPCGAVVLIDASSNTDRSVQAWKATRSIFGTFQEAILTRVEGGDRQYAFLGPGFEWDERDPDAWQPPGMVLRDERNRELWLSGCSGGYRGTGPHAAAYILLKEGFPPEQLRLVLTCDRLHLMKGSDPLVAETEPGPLR